MANKEILLVVDVFSNEREIDKELVFQAMESALEAATVKRYEFPVKVRVAIDRKTGDYLTFRRWEVVAPSDAINGDVEYPGWQVLLEVAQQDNPDIQIGDYVEDEVESVEFGRIAAQTAKQVIIQKVREAERRKIVEAYQSRVGELVTGIVKRQEKGNVILDLGGNVEAFIAKEDMIPRETVRLGDRLRGYLKDVRLEQRGPQLFVSRTAPELLIALFRLEVPEVGDGLVDVLAAARDPGARAKIAVKSNDPRLDPVGACVGMRGSRVQSVTNELAGERIDIILWNQSEAQFVINAMSPAEIQSIVVDEDKHSMDIAVHPDSLSQAIGRGGQNVRLASELTGWELNVIDAAKAEEDSVAEVQTIKSRFMEQLNLDEEIALTLAEVGFVSVEEIAYVPLNEMLQIEEFDEELVHEIRSRAKDFLLINAIASEEKIEIGSVDDSGSDDLLSLTGMNEDLALVFANKGIVTQDDLAEQSVDDLLLSFGNLSEDQLAGLGAGERADLVKTIFRISEEQLAALIMAARQAWFA